MIGVMTDDPYSKRVLAIAPNPNDFANRIRALAADSRNIAWSNHARERMEQRGISIRQALTVLREGMVVGKIVPGQYPGELKAKIVRNMKGRREVGVVVLLIRNNHIRVKTVEWEDL